MSKEKELEEKLMETAGAKMQIVEKYVVGEETSTRFANAAVCCLTCIHYEGQPLWHCHLNQIDVDRGDFCKDWGPFLIKKSTFHKG